MDDVPPPPHTSIRQMVQKALAFAHAALDDTRPIYVAAARRYAASVLPKAQRLQRRGLPLGEAHELLALVGQLRAVMGLLERQLEHLTGGPRLGAQRLLPARRFAN